MSSKAVFFVSCILPQSIFSLHLLNCHLYKLLIIFFSYNKFHQSNFDFNIIHLHNAVHVASWIIWMTSNVLSCNYSKTEFLLLIGLGQQLATQFTTFTSSSLNTLLSPVRSQHCLNLAILSPTKSQHCLAILSPIKSQHCLNLATLFPIKSQRCLNLDILSPTKSQHCLNLATLFPLQSSLNTKSCYSFFTPIQSVSTLCKSCYSFFNLVSTLSKSCYSFSNLVSTLSKSCYFFFTPIQSQHRLNIAILSPIKSQHCLNLFILSPVKSQHYLNLAILSPLQSNLNTV